MNFERGNQLKGYIQREIKDHPMHSNYAYSYFFCRNFLERLYGENKDHFILKGSYAQYSSCGQLFRPLTDIDIVTHGRIENANNVLEDVIDNNDKIYFQIKNRFVTTNSTINYKVLCFFDTIQHLISIDLKSENSLDTNIVTIKPLFSQDTPFDVNSISIEEHIATKLYIIFLNLHLQSKLGKPFRRLKDFYDIYCMLSASGIDEQKVFAFLREKVKDDDFLKIYKINEWSFTKDFISENNLLWEEERKKYQFNKDVSLGESVDTINDFVSKGR